MYVFYCVVYFVINISSQICILTSVSCLLRSGRRDISGGRLTSDLMTAENSARSKYFTAVTYSAGETYTCMHVCMYV